MIRIAVNALLLVIVIALLTVNWLLTIDPSKRNAEFLPDMVRSPRVNAFSVNASFADGKTLREPVPGTVIRGLMPLHYAATPADAQRAGRELTNPIRSAAGSLARGAVVYATYCEVCHGPAGKGDGVVAQRGFPAPPSLLTPKAQALADGQLFHIITYGQGNMPPYASQVGREDRWRAILYVRTLQPAKSPGAAVITRIVPPRTQGPGPTTKNSGLVTPRSPLSNQDSALRTQDSALSTPAGRKM